MPEPTYRLRMKTPWTGKIDGKERTVKAGEEADVDANTYQALVFQYEKAEPVSVQEIEAKVKAPKKKPTGRRASNIKAQTKPQQDKMQKTSTQKS